MVRMRRMAACLVVAVLWIVGCRQVSRAGRPSPAPESPVAAAVYDALITQLELDRKTVYVASASKQYRVGERTDSGRQGARADSVPLALAKRLEDLSRVPRAATTLSLPKGVRIVTEEESDRLQREGFGAQVVLAVSPVALSEDSSDALIYYELHCGGLCGHGAVAWFRRARDGGWHFQASRRYWIGEHPTRDQRPVLADVGAAELRF